MRVKNFLMLLKAEYFQKENKGKVLEVFYFNYDRAQFKILIPKQMLQKLPIALAQVKSGNIFEILIN